VKTVPILRTVIVIDDDPAIGELLTRVIQRLFPGQPVYVCQTGAEAYTYLAHTPVACVITDYDLGTDTTGVTLAATFHTIWPDLPIILITGLVLATIDLSPAHFVAVLTKPIQVATLRAVLQPYLIAPLGIPSVAARKHLWPTT
jgi:CheY-like chemotaxis protein